MESLQPNIQEEVFTGFNGYSTSWDFMTIEKEFELPNTVRVFWEKKSSFQARVASTGVCEIISIPFGRYTEYSLAQIIMFAKETEAGLSTFEPLFTAAVDEAILSLENSDTKTAWRLRHCPTYLQALDCDDDSQNCFRNVRIEAKDVKAFGKAFNERFSTKIQALQEDCKTFTVINDFTNIASLMENNHRFLMMNQFSEIAIEFERVFNTRDSALFWNRDSVTEFMRTTPSKEFYPGMLNRFGNFVFNVNQHAEDGIQISSVNFSSQLFNGTSLDLDGAAFTESSFTEYLAGFVSSQSRKNQCEAWLNEFQRTIDGYTKRSHLGASCKVIMKMADPKYETPHRMARHFQNTFGSETKNQLRSCTMSSIKKHIEENLYPPYHTLFALYTKRVESNQVITLDDIGLAEICEPILSFALYGTTRNMLNEPMYSPGRCKFYKLLESTFTTGPLFNGLRSLEHLRVVDGKIQIFFSKEREMGHEKGTDNEKENDMSCQL